MPICSPRIRRQVLNSIILFASVIFVTRECTARGDDASSSILNVSTIGQIFEVSLPTAHEGLGRSSVLALKNSTGKQVSEITFKITCKCLSAKMDKREIEAGGIEPISFRFIPTNGYYRQKCEISGTVEGTPVVLCEVGFSFKVEPPIATIPPYTRLSELREGGVCLEFVSGRSDIQIDFDSIRLLSEWMVLERAGTTGVRLRLKDPAKEIDRIPFYATFSVDGRDFDCRFYVSVVGDNSIRIEPDRLQMRTFDASYRSRFVVRNLPSDVVPAIVLAFADDSQDGPAELILDRDFEISGSQIIRRIVSNREFSIFELRMGKDQIDKLIKKHGKLTAQITLGDMTVSLPLDF